MKFVLLNCSSEDADTIFMTLYKRQISFLVDNEKDRSYICVDLDRIQDISFLGSLLRCKLLFEPFSFTHGDKKYCTLKIVREDNENKDSGNRVLSKQQGV